MSSIVRKPKNQLAASLYSLVTLHATHAQTAEKTLSSIGVLEVIPI